MIRFFATLAGVVAVVWLLSYFAMPAIPHVEGRDITPSVPDPIGDAFARVAPIVEPRSDSEPPPKLVSAQKEPDRKDDERKREDEKRDEKKDEEKGKGKGKGKGRGG